jgi:hypothetical protein
VLKVDNTAVREPSRSLKLEQLRPNATAMRCARKLDALTKARERAKATCSKLSPSTPPAREGHVGEISDALERSTAVTRPRSVRSKGCTAARWDNQDRTRELERVRKPRSSVRRARRPPSAHPRREDGPGRSRPRPEGDRHGVRRLRLRRRHRPAVPDARGERAQAVENDVHIVAVSSLAAGHLTLVPSCVSELPPRARGHHDRRRRRRPAAGLPTRCSMRAPRRLRTRHGHRPRPPSRCSTSSATRLGFESSGELSVAALTGSEPNARLCPPIRVEDGPQRASGGPKRFASSRTRTEYVEGVRGGDRAVLGRAPHADREQSPRAPGARPATAHASSCRTPAARSASA